MIPDSSAKSAPMMSDEEFRRRLRRNYWMDLLAYTIAGSVVGAAVGVGLVRLLMSLFG